MSAEMKNESAQGACAAYGCPLSGSLGRGDQWMCFCHYDADANAFQAITKAIRDLEPVTVSTLEIRRYFGTDEWTSAYRGVQRRLIEANRRDLLINGDDVSVKAWLARLETEILDACQNLKGARHTPPTVGTVPVIGPTHIAGYIEKTTGDNHVA
jgi:hypothetical protein